MIIFRKSALIPLLLLLCSCNQQNEKELKYAGKPIANPITYEVVVKNPNTDDEWRNECLANTDTHQLVKDIIEAVKKGDLKAYDYYDGHLLTKEEQNYLFNEEKIQDKIGKIQFTERWYWNKDQLKLQKTIESMMLGYEIYNDQGEVKGYKASFIIKL